jgi:hypothetical protein
LVIVGVVTEFASANGAEVANAASNNALTAVARKTTAIEVRAMASPSFNPRL